MVCSLSIRLISARLGCGRHVASHALIVRGRLWMYVQNEKRENDTQRLAVSHARFQNSGVETTLSVAPHTPRKARLKGCRTTAVSLTDFVRSNAQRRNVLSWPLPGLSRLRRPPCALSQAPRTRQGCNLYPQFSAQVRERDVPQGGVVLQATLRAPSSPGYGMAHLRRRFLGAGPARVASSRALEPTSFLVARHVTRTGDGPGIPRRETSPPCCEGQRTWVLATVVPARNPAKTLELQSFLGLDRVGSFAPIRGNPKGYARLRWCVGFYRAAKRPTRPGGGPGYHVGAAPLPLAAPRMAQDALRGRGHPGYHRPPERRSWAISSVTV